MPRAQPSLGDKITHGLCQSAVLIMALNAVFLGGGIAMALLAKIIAYGAVEELNNSFSDLALYVDDWENYLTTFEDVYGFAIMVFGLVIGVFSIAGGFAFWCRVTCLVVTYLVFIGFSILLCYAIGGTLVAFSHLDYLPMYNDEINAEITKALEGYCDDDEVGLSGENPILDLFRTTETATIVSSSANDQMEGCPVYDDDSDITCDEAKQQCASAVIAWLLDYLAPLGIWLCIIASAFVLVTIVAIYFLNVHNLWMNRRASIAIRAELGHDTLARDVTLSALKENNNRASWNGLSPTAALRKALPDHVQERVQGGRQSQFVNDAEAALAELYPDSSPSKIVKEVKKDLKKK